MLDTDQGAGGAVASRDAPGAGRTLRVSVLVHGATGLDSGESGIEPAAFVAAKTMREAAARLPSRAATRAIPKTRDPTWDEVVSVEVAEDEADREKVLLAVVNHDSNKLLAKAAVPLKALQIGRHYGFALDLGKGATLNVTVVIPQGPAKELEFLKKNQGVVRVEGSLTGVSGDAGGGYRGPVMARWTVVQDAAQARAAGPGSKIEAFVKVNAASESDVVSAASRLSGKKGEDVVPTLQGSSLAGPPLWPTGHRASLFVVAIRRRAGRRFSSRAPQQPGDDRAGGDSDVGFRRERSADGPNRPARERGRGRLGRGARRGGWEGFADRSRVAAGRADADAREGDRGGVRRRRRPSAGGEGAWMLSAMATDMIDKQQQLWTRRSSRSSASGSGRRICGTSATRRRRRSRGWRATTRSWRRLLHEERNADPAAGLHQLGLDGVSDVMEAKERLGQLAARCGQERRRNAELVHRLKATHEAQAGVEALKGRHLELQEAHAEMSRHLQKCEREANRVGKCRATIEMQEGIIARLEGLLEQSVVDRRRLAEAEAGVQASRRQRRAPGRARLGRTERAQGRGEGPPRRLLRARAGPQGPPGGEDRAHAQGGEGGGERHREQQRDARGVEEEREGNRGAQGEARGEGRAAHGRVRVRREHGPPGDAPAAEAHEHGARAAAVRAREQSQEPRGRAERTAAAVEGTTGGGGSNRLSRRQPRRGSVAAGVAASVHVHGIVVVVVHRRRLSGGSGGLVRGSARRAGGARRGAGGRRRRGGWSGGGGEGNGRRREAGAGSRPGSGSAPK